MFTRGAGTRRPLLAVACVDARAAWVPGKEGVVLGTTDGGATLKVAAPVRQP